MTEQTLINFVPLLLALVLLASLASLMHVPYAILLVLGGIILSFIPGPPQIVLDPNIVFFLFLPPLVFSDAWNIPWKYFRQQIRPIFSLAVGLVFVTMLTVAFVAHWLIPSLPWPIAFILGAILSPTDTVAAGTIINSLGLNPRLSTIIEGESLVNDATALVSFRFALAAVLGGSFSLWNAGWQFIFVSAGGIMIGLATAYMISFLLYILEDPQRQIILSLITPYAAYLLAELVNVSGILAALAAGLLLGHRSAKLFSALTRLQSDSFWQTIVFLLNGLLFLMIGLQLSTIIRTPQILLGWNLLFFVLIISAVVIIIRLLWTFAALWILESIPYIRDHFPRGSALVVGWAGMRGSVSLATALTVPLTLQIGDGFPARGIILITTFAVILCTLILQGLTLGPLIKFLNLNKQVNTFEEQRQARYIMTQAALARIDKLLQEPDCPRVPLTQLRLFYQKRTALYTPTNDPTPLHNFRERRSTMLNIQMDIHQIERNTLLELRDNGRIDEAVFHKLERELDLEEQRGSAPM